MKRPVRPGQPARRTALPESPIADSASSTAPKKMTSAQKSAAKKRANLTQAKPAKTSQKKFEGIKRESPKKSTKLSKVRPNRKQVKLEAKRLGAVARVQKRSRISRLASKLSPEARRFQAYSRRRRIVLSISFGSVAALFALVAATVFTPMLAVERVEIKGLDRIPEKAIRRILEKQIGKPLPLVNSDEIAVDLERFALIESFSAISQPPHSLQVRIRERQPIVIVFSGGQPYLYDPAGVQIGRAKASDKYPILTITGAAKNSAEFKAAIDVLLALPASLLPKLASIDAKSKDDVSMQLRGYAGQRIIWGDASQSVLKSKTLAALLKNQKRTDRVTFDVSSPTTPVVKY